MSLTQFLKLDWRKIVIFLILGVISYFTVKHGSETQEFIGFPLPYFVRGCPAAPPLIYSEEFCAEKVFHPFLIVDIIFWYILSCFIVLIFDKIKKKS